MRGSDRYSNRESVFGAPPDLANILATVDAGGTFGEDDYDYDGGGRGRGDRAESQAMIEEYERAAEVSAQQLSHLERQLTGAVAELALHKRHAQEFKAMLEVAEADLAASHEHATDLNSKLLLAQEGNRRNADMAQQLLTHLNTARVELKAQTRKNAQLQDEVAILQGNAEAASVSADGTSDRLSDRRSGRLSSEAASNASSTAAASPPSRMSARASSWRTQGSGMPGGAGSEQAALERFASRATLTPVTHDVGVQVELRSSRNELSNSRMGSVAMLALQHARELENVHRELKGFKREAPTDLVMERRPERPE